MLSEQEMRIRTRNFWTHFREILEIFRIQDVNVHAFDCFHIFSFGIDETASFEGAKNVNDFRCVCACNVVAIEIILVHTS